MSGILGVIISLVILAIVFGAVIWVIDWMGIPAPFLFPVRALVGLILIIYLLSMIGGVAPWPGHYFFPKG